MSIRSFFAGLAALVGFGGRDLAPKVGEPPPLYMPPKEAQRVYHSGGHWRGHAANQPQCPACLCTTARVGQCLVRDCSAFNGRLAVTNPALLSLDRETRLEAQRAWARGELRAA